MERYQDPNDALNASKYHTGKKCINCNGPAGTHWGKLWCQPCNAARMDRIGGFLQHEVDRLAGRIPEDSMYEPPLKDD